MCLAVFSCHPATCLDDVLLVGSDEDLHHVVVHFLLGQGWRRGLLLWVGLDKEPPLQGAAVKHWHIYAGMTKNIEKLSVSLSGDSVSIL